MQKNCDRPILLLTAAQVMLCGAMAVILGGWALSVCFVLREWTQTSFAVTVTQALHLVCGTGVAVCGLTVMAEMFRLLGRVKRETAFTAKNVTSLRRVSLAFFAAALLFLPVGESLMDLVLWGTFAAVSRWWGLLPTFLCGMAGLLVRAIVLLLRRAVDMQDDSDLTV